MRKVFVLFLVLLAGAFAAPSSPAQGVNPPQQTAFATEFGQWVIVSQAPGTYTFYGTNNPCQIPKPGGGAFAAFTVGTPVFIRDALNPGHNEVVTVSSVVNTSSSCGFTASMTYAHTSFSVLSATAGLQEAINALGGAAVANPQQIVINRNWYIALTGLPGYTSATPAAVLGALTGNANVFITDQTTAPFTFSEYNGSKYVAVSGALGGVQPGVVALGAAAGTAPSTPVIVGNSSVGTVNFTAGTATTTGTIFTITYPTTGSFGYTPSTCTVTSIGANAYTTGTVACTYSANHVVLTFTEATAPLTASTAYSFRYKVE